MKRSLLLLLPAIAVLLMCSCKRGDNNSLISATPGGYASLDDIFARIAPPATTQSIVVSTGGDVVSKGGTHVTFPKDAFQSYSGAVVSGSVDVKVYDWVQKGDMVFGKVLPVSNNIPLYSSGQAYIEVTQKGVPIRLRKGVRVDVKFPQFSTGTSGDTLYLGRAVEGSVNRVNWYTAAPAAGEVNLAGDEAILSTDSFHYVAASRVLAIPGYSDFTVKVNSPVELEQNLAVALFDNLKAVYPVASAVNGTVNAHVPTLPMHLVVMGVNKGVFYAGMAPLDPAPLTDSSFQIQVKQVDPNAFRLQMNALQ